MRMRYKCNHIVAYNTNTSIKDLQRNRKSLNLLFKEGITVFRQRSVMFSTWETEAMSARSVRNTRDSIDLISLSYSSWRSVVEIPVL